MPNNPFENFQNLGFLKKIPEEYEHVDNEEPKDILDQEVQRPSFFVFYLVVVLVAFLFLYKLIDLQIVQGVKFQYLAEGNRIRTRDIPAPRGLIYDKNGVPLAKNVAEFNLELFTAELPFSATERLEVYNKIEQISQIPSVEIKSQVEKTGLYSMEPIILKENISRDEALILKIKYKDVPGVVISARPVRQYENIPGISHILGYIGKINEEELKNNPDYHLTSFIGKTGIELTHENSLRGKDGKEQVEVDSRGRIQRALASLDPLLGNNIYLGIDANFQKEIEIALSDMIKKTQVSSGSVVAIDPKDGKILGMVSIPYYDNNIFRNSESGKYQELLNDENKPMVNRAIAGIFPSGSTIKPFIAATALEEGIISENTTIKDPGEITIDQWIFPDWKNHGMVNVRKAIAESCNVFFYAVGGGWDKIKGLGAEKMKKYLEMFGFGLKTGIDLNGESEGLIPSPEWKKKTKNESWYLGDSYHMAIGQGDLLVTPLQLARATAAIANGGELLKPHLAVRETDAKGNIIKEYSKDVVKKDFIDSDNLRIVREGMRQTVTSGSAKQLSDLSFAVAGKTGTAQFDQTNRTHAWFIGFAPYEDPKIAFAILIEAGGEGHDVAVPVAKKILEWYFANN